MDFFKTFAIGMKNLDNNPFARFVVRLLMYSLLGWIFLGLNSFGIGDKTDQATQDALYKLAAPYYLSDAQKDIVIVLINQNSITELYQRKAIEANEWPIRYRDHAYLLSRILKYQPRSVFVDIYFKQKRSTDDSFDQAVRQLDRLSKKYDIPLLLAGGYYDEEFTPVQEKMNELGELVLSGWQDYGQSYPLDDHGHLSTAYRLYQLACLAKSPLASCQSPTINGDEIKAGDAVSVRWGNRPGEVIFPEFAASVCADRSDSSWEVVRQLFSGLVEGLKSNNGATNSSDTQCAYHSVIYADELVYVDKSGTEKQKQRLAAALKNKVVMYALSLEGLHDTIYSPVHGQLPGVFFHAMALDNLMHYGADFVRASDGDSEAINQGLWIVITLAFSGLLFRYERKGIRFNDESKRPDDNIKPKCGLSVFWLSASAAILIFAISLIMFLWVRYEPLNSIGFLVLIGASSWLVHSDFAGKVLRVISYPWRRGDEQVAVISIIPFTHTSSPEEAAKFYRDIFGFELVMSCDWKKTYSADSDKNPRLSFAGKGDFVPDLSIEVDDYDLALKCVKSAKIKIQYDSKKNDCEVRQFYIRDPFGKLVSVFQYEKDISKIRKRIRKYFK